MTKETNDTKKTLKALAQAIYDKKGFNIIAIDVRGISSVTDYFLIANGNVDRHVQALSQEVKHTLEKLHQRLYSTEGTTQGSWAAIDCGDILVHLFTEEFREKYLFDQIWKDGKIVDLQIKIEKASDLKGI